MNTSRLSQIHRTAFVTGASAGLGRAFAEMLLAEGVRVWGTSRDPRRLDALVSGHGAAFTPVALELGDGPGAAAALAAADRAAGGFDLVINNAGYGVFGPFASVEFEVWRDQIDKMLVSTARLSHEALRLMDPRNRGALVNVSSLAVEFPLPFQSAYNIAKAGLTALNESLMVETRGTGIVIIDLRPGDYRTEFEGSVQRPAGGSTPRADRAWAAFVRLMAGGPPPAHAAAALRKALLRNRSGTVRCGRLFQAVISPFLVRLGSLPLKRRIQAGYFDV